MDFSLTKQEELFLQMIREFAENEVKPLAAEIDDQERFPLETVEKMSKIGLMGIPVPKEYGGQGGTNQMYTMAVEELSRVCATTGVVLSAHTSLCIAPIMENGTEEQKQKYVPRLASGEWIGAFGLTEPNAGTDAAMQQTTAVEDGDSYILNGSKIFITNAGYAHVYVIFAMTDKSLGNKGISAFIVEKGTPGFSIGKKEKKLGIRGSATCELIFENCRIPKENLLGKVGKGFVIAMKTLDGGRIGIASQALGIAQGAMDETVKYTKKAIWKEYSTIPKHSIPTCRDGNKCECCKISCSFGCIQKGPRYPLFKRRCNGKALCCTNCNGGYNQSRSASRRIRIHKRISC